MDIGKSLKSTRVLNRVAAGTTDQKCDGVDRQGFEGVRFTVSWGAISATAVARCKVQQSDDDVDGHYTDLASSFTTALTATTDDNKITVVDVYKPTKRWIRLYVDRGTANAEIDSVTADAYGCTLEAVTQPSKVTELKTLIGPAEGTA
jgi:hypothetical protein